MMGPLDGRTVVEVAGIGPGPFCAMMLADMGATVIRVDRASLVTAPGNRSASPDVLNRGRRSIAVDLKHSEGADIVLKLCEQADALIEGFRPGVAERLGIGPEPVHARNPRVVYGRMTGWGQSGPRSARAGHDIDYLAVSGVLGALGPGAGNPVPPLNLVADFGGGGMLLAFGIVCGLLEAETSGRGQVIDAAMVEGSALLSTMIYGLKHQGLWPGNRGENLLDGGAPFYSTYATSDGRFVAVGALEPQFFAALVQGLGLADADLGDQYDRERWPHMRSVFAAAFAARTQEEWERVFGETDACVVPVYDFDTAGRDPHNEARATFIEVAGYRQPAPAPRFSRSSPGEAGPASFPGSHTNEILMEFGWSQEEAARLHKEGVVR